MRMRQSISEFSVARAVTNHSSRGPVIFINEARVTRLELREAAYAFLAGREYIDINPLVDRFDKTLDIEAEPPSRVYLHYPLAEIVFDLWQTAPDLWTTPGVYFRLLRARVESDRAMADPPTLASHFCTAIGRNLRLYGIQFPADRVTDLAGWIYEDAGRCPASRLVYEVYHQIRRNNRDALRPSDMGDLGQVPGAPLCGRGYPGPPDARLCRTDSSFAEYESWYQTF